jgi:riboflavin kinase/FMN adenylyltransferase
MRFFRSYLTPPRDAINSITVLGNFDGVHRGHQGVLAVARRLADRHSAPLLVVTFEPHPRQFFAPHAPPFRLTDLRAKLRLAAACGVDAVLAIRFDRAFSRLSPEDFVARVLVQSLKIRAAVIGQDFAFGFRRAGTAGTLAALGRDLGFGVELVAPVQALGETSGAVFSSRRIRQALAQGEIAAATKDLGHWWEIERRVRRGSGRGRMLGYPTANCALLNSIVPKEGVYAVRAEIVGLEPRRWFDGVANLGRRPTFEDGPLLLEVHLFGVNTDLYGRRLRVAFVQYLRPERKFADLDALKAQIATDVEQAKAVLAAPQNRREIHSLEALSARLSASAGP